jgi:hypothetical protein
MTTLGSTPTKRTHLPELGPRGEGWVVLQGLPGMDTTPAEVDAILGALWRHHVVRSG